MRRYISIVTVTLMLLTLMSANIRPPMSFANAVGSISPEEPRQPAEGPVLSQGKEITIIFRGLMVGRYAENSRFEVGILKGIEDDHEFELEIWDGEWKSLTKDIGKKVYEFVVVDNNGSIAQNPVSPYITSYPNFDRKQEKPSQDPYKEDYRYLPDLEASDLHKEAQKRRDKPFKHVFHVLNGKFKNGCVTLFPIKKKILGASPAKKSWEAYGYISEILEVKITLSENQRLILREQKETAGNKKELWRCSFNPNKPPVGAIVLHQPKEDESDEARHLSQIKKSKSTQDFISYRRTFCAATESKDHCSSHFQYYYTHALDVDVKDRYELRGEIVKYEKIKTKMQGVNAAIYPYKCGMALQGKTDKPIDDNYIDDQM